LGYPILDDEAVPAALLAHARRAAQACPTVALVVERVAKVTDPTIG
jgi:ferredoxin